MSEWLRISLSTSLGFVSAMIGIPASAALQGYLRRRQLRRALYLEIGINLTMFVLCPQVDEQSAGGIARYLAENKVWLRHEVFDHAQQAPEIFFQLREFPAILEFHARLRELADHASDDDIQMRWADTKTALLGLFQEGLDEKYLFREMVWGYCNEIQAAIRQTRSAAEKELSQET